MTWTTIGIDPAPKSDAGIWLQGGGFKKRPQELRSYIESLGHQHQPLLIAWDAPLAFAPDDLSDRTIDKAVRRWVKRHVETGRFAAKAIGVRPFAGLSHWTVTCATLGLPFGEPPLGLQLAPDDLDPPPTGGVFAIEVHPAVALGVYWLEAEVDEPLPRYKKNPNACATIAERLHLPMDAAKDDDLLDAFIAWKLAEDFARGEAGWAGKWNKGGYVLPRCKTTDEISLPGPPATSS